MRLGLLETSISFLQLVHPISPLTQTINQTSIQLTNSTPAIDLSHSRISSIHSQTLEISSPQLLSRRFIMDVFYSYTYGTCGWLFLQAAPLIISPTMIVAMLSPEVREASRTLQRILHTHRKITSDTIITALEIYFSRSLGLSLITLGILCVLLTGSVPLNSRLEGKLSLAFTPVTYFL